MRVFAFLFVSLIYIKSGFTGNLIIDLAETNSSSRTIYDQIGNRSMSFEAFDLAFRGWTALKDSIDLREDVITVVDFSQPSTNKRFYLINMETKEVIFQDYVSHGKNTGNLMAERFSNIPYSNQSSLGFYKTAETYHGKHGLSLKLDGLENGINDLARQRAIVIHAAKYAEESFIKKYGRLGRSFGCPALPAKNYNQIIELIKGGTLLFIYFPESGYLNNSTVLN
jgi:hypothetical protein